jgi:hypothetical protein
MENRKLKEVLPGRIVTSRQGREEYTKGYRRVNIVEILYRHICKWKNETC